MQAAELCDALGITIVPTTMRLRPGATHAHRIIDRLVAEHGVSHATLTLRAIAETEGNARQLSRHVILAVSDVLASHPRWADAGLALLSAFDHIDLGKLRAIAKAAKVSHARHAIATLLYIELEKHLGSPVPPKATPKKQEPRPSRLEAQLPTVRANIATGIELMAMSATIKNNREAGRLRQQLGIGQAHAAKCIRVAKAYADREDIVSRLPWPALVELAAAPPGLRHGLEERLIAGERLTAKQIRQARTNAA